MFGSRDPLCAERAPQSVLVLGGLLVIDAALGLAFVSAVRTRRARGHQGDRAPASAPR